MSVSTTKLDKTKSLLAETRRVNKQLKRENKRLKKMLESNDKSKKMDMERGNSDLKKLLKETKIANKRLKQQNKRQKQVWFALQQMCQALGGTPMETNKSDKSPLQTKPKKSNIQLISISSKLKRFPSGDKYNMSVKYTSKRKPGVYWTISTNTNSGIGGRYGTRGWTEYTKSNKTYISGIELNHDLLLSYFIYLRIYVPPDFVTLNLNMSGILKEQTNEFEDLLFEVHGDAKPLIAPTNANMTVSLNVQGNVSEFSSFDIYMGGLDYTKQPPRMFEIGSYSDEFSVKTHRISNSSVNVTITTQPHVSENGGMLSIAGVHEAHKPLLFENVQYGKLLNVLSNNTKTVVRPGTIGLFPMEKVTVVYPPLDSIMCGAMGFEKPDIVLVRETNDGPQEMQHDVFVEPDKHTVIKTFTVNVTDSKAEGYYTCIASTKTNGVSVSLQTEVVRYEPPVIIETATGVIANTNDFVEVKCTATGNPEPILELRLYDEYGPDLSRNMFKVARSNPEPKTAALVVTINPVIRDIYKVYCVARIEGYEEYKDIEIFPEPEGGPNWELRYNILDNSFFNNTFI